MTTSLWQLLWHTTHWVCHVCKHWHSSICSRLSSFEEMDYMTKEAFASSTFSAQAPGKCTTWPRTTPWPLPALMRTSPAHPTAIPFPVGSFHLLTYAKICSSSEKFFFSRYIQTDNSQNTSKPHWFNRGSFPSLFLGKEVFQALNHWHWSDS